MMRACAPFFLSVALLLSSSAISFGEETLKPRTVMGSPAKYFYQFFENPDEWKETRANISAVLVADHALNSMYSDEQLSKWLPQLKVWGLELELEVGAIKEWGITADATLKRQKPFWDRFQRLGGKIASLAMDEPLVAVRSHLKREGINKPDEYAVEETAKFIAQVRADYPDVRIGDVEGYPSIPAKDHMWWIDALQGKLKEMGVRGLDFYRLDVDWHNFDASGKGSWKEVLEIEKFCRSRNIPSSNIYWAANYPSLKRLGMADDTAWYVGVLSQGYRYASAGGKPDEFVVQSWVKAPSVMTPDSEYFTFSSSVRDFVRKIVKAEKP
jgi:hypothetical protein